MTISIHAELDFINNESGMLSSSSQGKQIQQMAPFALHDKSTKRAAMKTCKIKNARPHYSFASICSTPNPNTIHPIPHFERRKKSLVEKQTIRGRAHRCTVRRRALLSAIIRPSQKTSNMLRAYSPFSAEPNAQSSYYPVLLVPFSSRVVFGSFVSS